MKSTIYIVMVTIAISLSMTIQAQEFASKLNEATSAYNSGKLDDARFALQQALGEIDKAIGKEILGMLPNQLGNMGYSSDNDQVTGASASITGLYVNRSYGADPKSVQVEIMSDSPLLTSLNTLLSLPVLMGSSDPNQKRVKVSGYKALLQKNTGENNEVSYDLQIPVKNTLITLHCKGIESENDILSMAAAIPVDKIVKISQ